MQVAVQSQPIRRRQEKRKSVFANDLLVKLHELLQGERAAVKVYSKALNEEIEFVNHIEGPVANDQVRPTYTTRELSMILSMTADELRKYHYFKTRLV